MWETSTDNDNAWNQIDSTSNPLIYNNTIDCQKFRAVTSMNPTCSDYLTTKTTVNVVANPAANQPMDLEICDDTSHNGIASLNLSSINI